MKKKTKRVLGATALAAGALAAAAAYLKKKKGNMGMQHERAREKNVWARPGMIVTFRAELMPGRDREQRTARVKEVLPSGRVTLQEVAGEHAQNEFEAL
ncbi:MAG TPA: hypothetical protein VIT88_05830 [Pyrinomonadaceae bacterium]